MDLKERADFYEKIYYFDLDLREKIDNRLKLPMTVFALLSAMMVFFLNETIVNHSFSPTELFCFLFSTACLSFFAAIYYFVKSWYGYKYKLIPTSIELENYFHEIKSSYMEVNLEKAEGWAKEAFQEYLLNSFRDYGSHNTVNNDKKSFNLHRSITLMLVSFVLMMSSFLPYYSSI